MRKRIFSALAILLALPSLTRAEPLAENAPADAIAYFSFKGSDNLGPAYDNSDLKPILDASAFPKFYHELVPQLLEKTLANDPNGAQSLAQALTAIEILARHGLSLYVVPVADGTTPIAAGLTCDAGADADALEKNLSTLATDQPDLQLTIRRTGTRLAIHVGRDAQPDGPSLAAAPAFRSALKQVNPDPVLLVYIDFERLFTFIDTQTNTLDGTDNPWRKVKSTAGLDGLKRYAFTGSFAGKDWSTQSFTDAPAPREGWLALLQGGPLPKDLLARVPTDATFVRTAHFDPVGWVNNFRKIAVAVGGPDGQQKFDQVVGLAQIYVGRNIMTDVLGPLGTEWTVFSSPSIAGESQLGAVFVNKLSDEEKARNGLIAVTYALANTSQNPKIKASGLAAIANQVEIAGVKITSLKFSAPNPRVAAVTPAWAIKDGYLYLGLTPQAVAAAANFAGPSFPDSPHLAEARAKLSAPPESNFEFATIPPESYSTIRTIADMGIGMLNANGVRISTNPLPPADAVTPHLRPVVELSWTDDAGFHSKSSSPFPGATLLTPSGLTSVGTASLVTSIALPSLTRARETANRVKCASNMKQISGAIEMHALEHQHHYPPDLGILAATQDIDANSFYCPDSSSTPSSTHSLTDGGMKLDAIPAHVNAHTDFTYVGQNLTTESDPKALVLYEKIDNHTDGMNMLFVDGYVQFYLRKDAERIIADKRRTQD